MRLIRAFALPAVVLFGCTQAAEQPATLATSDCPVCDSVDIEGDKCPEFNRYLCGSMARHCFAVPRGPCPDLQKEKDCACSSLPKDFDDFEKRPFCLRCGLVDDACFDWAYRGGSCPSTADFSNSCFCELFVPADCLKDCGNNKTCQAGCNSLSFQCDAWSDSEGAAAECPIAISSAASQVVDQFVHCPCNNLAACETAQGGASDICFSKQCRQAGWTAGQSSTTNAPSPITGCAKDVPDLRTCDCWGGKYPCDDWNQGKVLKCPLTL